MVSIPALRRLVSPAHRAVFDAVVAGEWSPEIATLTEDARTVPQRATAHAISAAREIALGRQGGMAAVVAHFRAASALRVAWPFVGVAPPSNGRKGPGARAITIRLSGE